MRHRTTPRFWEHYRSLPNEVRELADKNFRWYEAHGVGRRKMKVKRVLD